MDIPRETALRGIHIGVSVDPNQPNLLILSPKKGRSSGNASGGYGVISSQDQGELVLFQRLTDATSHNFANLGDLLEENFSLLPTNSLFWDLDLKIPPIFYSDVHSFQLSV